jgi:GNAT superfamily N-acetyltransferase
MEWRKDQLLFSDERNLLDIQMILEFLSGSYWAKERSPEKIHKSIVNSFPYGLYRLVGSKNGGQTQQQVGFCRITSDWAAVAWLSDFFVHPDHQGKGWGRWMMSCLLSDPRLRGLKLGLRTSTAHGFYEKFGFSRQEMLGLKID